MKTTKALRSDRKAHFTMGFHDKPPWFRTATFRSSLPRQNLCHHRMDAHLYQIAGKKKEKDDWDR